MVARDPRDYDFGPENYEEYELEPQERLSVDNITVQVEKLRAGAGPEDRRIAEAELRGSITYLEHLEHKLDEILKNEQSIGYHNDTLYHDYHKIKNLLSALNVELDKIDPAMNP